MIQFTAYTETHITRNPPATFPSFIYKLTEFNQISDVIGRTENFIGNSYISVYWQTSKTI
jgi:hypothetical protein